MIRSRIMVANCLVPLKKTSFRAKSCMDCKLFSDLSHSMKIVKKGAIIGIIIAASR